jgi:hypothetical protein
MAHEAGKGSVRRKENAQAVLNNWNLIFGKKPDKPEENNGVRKDTPTVPKLPKQ